VNDANAADLAAMRRRAFEAASLASPPAAPMVVVSAFSPSSALVGPPTLLGSTVCLSCRGANVRGVVGKSAVGCASATARDYRPARAWPVSMTLLCLAVARVSNCECFDQMQGTQKANPTESLNVRHSERTSMACASTTSPHSCNSQW
jgi:hypothetical protein